jgi:hypothetical protein
VPFLKRKCLRRVSCSCRNTKNRAWPQLALERHAPVRFILERSIYGQSLANALKEQAKVAQTNLTLNLTGIWDETELELAIEKNSTCPLSSRVGDWSTALCPTPARCRQNNVGARRSLGILGDGFGDTSGAIFDRSQVKRT